MSDKFEYRFVRATFEDARNLKDAGADGWEAVNMLETDDDFIILMKRRIAADQRKT